MKRVHTPELEDMTWFPATLRASLTNLLAVFARKLGLIPVLATLIARALAATKQTRIVDLGSGSGGSLPDVVDELRRAPMTASVELLMTDKFPNPDAVARFADPDRPFVRYAADSVDATNLAGAPAGVKTMVNCFHHMRPAQARAILESAHRERQPLVIYELADNKVAFAVWLVFLPLGLVILTLMALALTFGVRPLSPRQLLFTFVIPIVPLVYAWDGQMSLPRIYTLDDLDELLAGLSSDDYVWEKGYAKDAAGKNKGIYLLGLPR